MDENTDRVSVQVSEGVATIRIDRPPMNALDSVAQRGLRRAAAEVGDRRDVRAVVIYGGPKVFAAGADVKEMVEWDHLTAVEKSAALTRSFSAVAEIPKPTIAAITGYALGGGLELALCADLRIAGDNAKLGQPEILLGIIPGAGGTQRLSRLVGVGRAKDLIYTGRFVKADEALAMGLVNQVVPPDEVYEEAVALARRLAAGPPWALRAAKTAIDRGIETDLATGLDIERAQFAGLFATRDQNDGMRSFVEHGPGHAEFEGC
ncbi:MAG: enoyl-CoA hydratase-related protein [Candidatus Nanopelagicales bacterium]|nr:enoyl-CoA hydratase-related protein [Candidatus Nanopelagicales bacterium]